MMAIEAASKISLRVDRSAVVHNEVLPIHVNLSKLTKRGKVA